MNEGSKIKKYEHPTVSRVLYSITHCHCKLLLVEYHKDVKRSSESSNDLSLVTEPWLTQHGIE